MFMFIFGSSYIKYTNVLHTFCLQMQTIHWKNTHNITDIKTENCNESLVYIR